MGSFRRVKQAAALAIFIPLVLALFPLPAAAQQPPEGAGVRVTVEPFLGGVVHVETWLPLHVQMENGGTDTVVEVTATFRRSGGQEETFARRVELPAGARKETVLYVRPNSFSREITVYVEQGEEQTAYKVPLQVQGPDVIVVGVAGADEGALEAFRVLDVVAGRAVNVVPVRLSRLPTYAAAWRNLNALVLAGVDTTRLSPEQQRALTWWVAQGGTLVVGGGPTPRARQVLAGLPEVLRPVEVTGDVALDDLPALSEWAGEPVRVPGPFIAAQGQPVEGATVAIAQGDAPLLVRRTVDMGSVLWLALDPAASPFDAWAGTDDFWKRALAESPGAAVMELPRPPDAAQDAQMAWALGNLPSLQLPSLVLMAVLFLAYVVVVGPLNYFVLRRRRRLEWAWGTIPAITLVFSALTLGLGRNMRGQDLIVHEISVHEIYSQAQVQLNRSYTLLFSPRRTAYRFELPDAPLLSLLGNMPDFFGSPLEPGRSSATAVRFYQGATARAENFRVNQWDARPFVAEYPPTEAAGLQVELLLRDEAQASVAVRSRLPAPIQDAALVLSGRAYPVGDIPAMGERNAPLPPFTGGATFPFEPASIQLYPFGGVPDRDQDRRRQVIQAVLESSPTSIEPAFIGWVEEGRSRLRVEGSRYRGERLTFIVASVTMRAERGVPPILTPERFLTGQEGICYGSVKGLAPFAEDVEIAYRLPPGVAPGQVTELLLLLQHQGGWVDPPEMAVWDWDQEAWAAAEVAWGLNTVPKQGRRLVAPDGEVRLRIARSPGGGPCMYVFLGARTGAHP